MRFTVTTTTNDGQTVSTDVGASELSNYLWGLTRYVTEGVYPSFTVTRIEEGAN